MQLGDLQPIHKSTVRSAAQRAVPVGSAQRTRPARAGGSSLAALADGRLAQQTALAVRRTRVLSTHTRAHPRTRTHTQARRRAGRCTMRCGRCCPTVRRRPTRRSSTPSSACCSTWTERRPQQLRLRAHGRRSTPSDPRAVVRGRPHAPLRSTRPAGACAGGRACMRADGPARRPPPRSAAVHHQNGKDEYVSHGLVRAAARATAAAPGGCDAASAPRRGRARVHASGSGYHAVRDTMP